MFILSVAGHSAESGKTDQPTLALSGKKEDL